MTGLTAPKGVDLMITNKLSFSGNKGKQEVLCSFDEEGKKITASDENTSSTPKRAAEVVSQLSY